jgi:hypothetical protein
MTKIIAIVLLSTFPVLAQIDSSPPTPPLTDREQIQADRARAVAQERADPLARPWDRDAVGKRPWERDEHAPRP